MVPSYRSIVRPVEGLFRDRGSKFLAYAYPVAYEQEVKDRLEELRQLHPKAWHHCFAYRLLADGSLFRTNDDGEPSGTAGKPILGQIDSFELTQVLIVVVRYFGGKLLGASGLIHAYRESAADALRQASIHEIIVKTSYQFTFDYAIMGTLMDALNRYGASIDGKRLDANPALQVSLPIGEAEQQVDQIVAAALGRHIEEVAGKRKFDLLQINTIADS